MADKMTAQDFAQKVRAKYPGAYDSLSDEELTQKVLKKFPQYGQQIDLSTATPKTQFEKDRDPENQKGFWQTLGANAKSMLLPKAQNPYPGMGTDQKVEAANEAVQQDAARKASGRSLGYRALAPVAQSVGLNVPGMEDAADKGDTGGVLGHAAAAAAPAIISGATNVAGAPIGEGLKRGGTGILNRTIGALKTDFSHGANPAEGYLAGGGTPSLTLGGLADKAHDIVQDTGAKLGQAYDNSKAIIPADAVRAKLGEPIGKLERLQSGPGGTGVSPQIENYRANMEPVLKGAEERGGFTPRELFDQVKRPIAESTNWKDPSQFDLNTVRQQNVGATGGLLSDAVPETEPLNRIYQGANKFAKRADYRADTGVSPLSQIARRGMEGLLGGGLAHASGHPLLAAVPLMADSVPVRSTAAVGMYRFGKGLQSPLAPSVPLIASPAANVRRVNDEQPEEKPDQQ